MINRNNHINRVLTLLRNYRVVAIVGARQVGKTTLARQIEKYHKTRVFWFDLEDPRDRARLAEPMLVLPELKGLVILDEIQNLPEVFPILRVLADRKRSATRFLLLGSASPELLKQSSESLAGRIAYYELGGFGLREVGSQNLSKLWLRGTFPTSYLARSNEMSQEWRHQFIRTFLERDLPQLGISTSATTMRRFWTMLSHYHGQIWNASDFSRSFGVADTTIRNYLDTLCSTFMVRMLKPFHTNIRKRQVKAPKIYIADTGILHNFLSLTNKRDLLAHPKLGASWEGFALAQVVEKLDVRWDDCFFWATHSGSELDLLVIKGKKRLGFEFKLTTAPKTTKSMHYAITDLGLKHLYIVHAGKHCFPLHKKISALAATEISEEL